MRFIPILTLLAFLAGCGGDDGPAAPDPDPDPEVGVPDGDPSSATIGSGGGALASSDGAFSLTVPAGALSSDTAITIQPITNTAPGGLAKGYRLSPDGLQFAAPIDITFEIADDVLAVTAPEFLDGAVQRSDGRWGILAIEDVDMSARTLKCQTSHFSDYSMVSGVQIQPAAATIDPRASIVLSPVLCSREPITGGDDDLVALVGTCDPDLVPLGTFTDWSANGIVGGSAAVGTVVPTGNQATYTAPATAPASNPVAVSVVTTFEDMSALLVSNITVRGAERWVGTCTAVFASGTLQVDDLVWEFYETDGYQRFFRPRGTVKQTTLVLPGKTVSYTPDSDPIIPDESGGMSIDYTTDPPTFAGGGADYWILYACFLTLDGVYCADWPAGGAWFGAYGEVTENGTKIEGTNVGGPSGELFTFSFTREE